MLVLSTLTFMSADRKEAGSEQSGLVNFFILKQINPRKNLVYAATLKTKTERKVL